MPLRSPLILDLDGGVLPLPRAQTLALPQWHDPLRFACSNATLTVSPPKCWHRCPRSSARSCSAG
jgi:hypothetical protein